MTHFLNSLENRRDRMGAVIGLYYINSYLNNFNAVRKGYDIVNNPMNH